MTPEAARELAPGTRVTHGIFGPGTVIETGDPDGSMFGEGGSITIRFDDHGTKQLVLYFTARKLEVEWP